MPSLRRFLPLAALCLAAVGLTPLSGQQAPAPGAPSAMPASRQQQIAAGEVAARAECATCHKLPPPDVLPRPVWRSEMTKMLFFKNTGRLPESPREVIQVRPPAEWLAIAAYYEAKAPDRLAPPERWPDPDQVWPFRRRVLSVGNPGERHSIANIRLVDLDNDTRLEMVLSDMNTGVIYAGRPYEASGAFRPIAQLSNPSHIAAADLDGDSVRDLLVADLASFAPADHDRGAVVWLRGRRDGTYLTKRFDGWPRVSDVEVADFDGDRRPDLAVAAFGWHTTGDLSIMKNATVTYDAPSFTRQQIDPRHGAIHSIPVDMNADGRPDIVSLFAQEHEAVVAFLNDGGFRFTPRVIYEGPHPNWGSSGIEVVDLDRDGDLDVLVTNGDSFDDSLLKPYHGIQWLENRGTYPFAEHKLAGMAAVHRAQAVDLDGDGDLDVVACAMAPPGAPEIRGLPSVVWLEQTTRGVFARHVLESGMPMHPTLDVGDIDNDGDMDIVVGNFAFEQPVEGLVTVFENLLKGR